MAEYRDPTAAGRWILEYRDKIGLTQEEFTKKWHINRTRLGDIENGNIIPSVEDIERLKRECALSFNDWLGLRGAYLRTTGHLLRLDDSDYTVEVVTPEQQFVAATTNLPTIQIGDLRVPSRLIPTDFWGANRKDHIYTDDGEFTQQIEVVWTESTLPDDTISQLSREMLSMMGEDRDGTIMLPEQRAVLQDTYELITRKKSNPYPRVVAMPEIISEKQGDEIIHTFRIQIGHGKFGIAAIDERRNILPPLPTAIVLRSQYNLQAFAIRVAYIGKDKSSGRRWVEFQQREGSGSATWKNAWDVGGAGYVDYIRHQDPEDDARLSVWQSACDEIQKELGIPEGELPFRDNCHFFGFAKDEPTGHLILLGYCISDFVPTLNRPPKDRVRAYGRCELTPEAVASFLEEKKHWVPSAVLTLYLMLEAEGFDRDRERIVRAFSSLELDFDAYRGIGSL